MTTNYQIAIDAYKETISKMTDQELTKECEEKIWLAAYAANNPRSCYHWQCDACYDECKNRNKKHLYESAYNYAKNSE